MIAQEKWKDAQTVEAAYWAEIVQREDLLLYELTEHSEVIKLLLPFISEKTGLRALEVGIGPLGVGFLAVYAAVHCAHITGVEPLPILNIDVVDQALKQYILNLRSRVEVVPAKGEELPFDEESFDLLCCINVLDHVWTPQEILKEMARVAAPGALLVLGVHTFALMDYWEELGLRLVKPTFPNFIAHPHVFTWRRIESLLRSQGWGLCQVDRQHTHRRLFGKRRMSFWIATKEGS